VLEETLEVVFVRWGRGGWLVVGDPGYNIMLYRYRRSGLTYRYDMSGRWGGWNRGTSAGLKVRVNTPAKLWWRGGEGVCFCGGGSGGKLKPFLRSCIVSETPYRKIIYIPGCGKPEGTSGEMQGV